MKPITQSRIGANGTCFRSCLASIFEVPERAVPDFRAANLDPAVNQWLSGHGLRYKQLSIDSPAPVGWHTIEGVSPRGGQHAVVGWNGRVVHDPHPQDGTGRGLVKPEFWGALVPATGRVKDHLAAAALEPVYAHHDVIKDDYARSYATHSLEVQRLIDETQALLKSARLRDKQFWGAKLREAEMDMIGAKSAFQSGDARAATRHQEHALAIAHHVLDALKSLTRRTEAKDSTPCQHCNGTGKLSGQQCGWCRGKKIDVTEGRAEKIAEMLMPLKNEAPPHKPGDRITLKNGKRATVKSVTKAENLFHEPEWHVNTTTGDVVTVKIKE